MSFRGFLNLFQRRAPAELLGSMDESARSSATDKIELKEEDIPEKLGFAFPTHRKWMILSIIFMVQVSMNFNASVYGNAIVPLTKKYDISEQYARVGQLVFLVAYAFGCELWAPWSEELGRRPILQWSLGLVNLWQIPCALAPNFATVIVFRLFGGLSLSGGSVTLGMVADMWNADNQQYAVAFVVLSSVGGSVIGPIVGGFIEKYLPLQWNFWIQLLLGVTVQVAHYFVVPETRASVITTKEAAARRKQGQTNVFSTDEIKANKMKMKEIVTIWLRPFHMFLTEPIVLWLSLLSGFSDALIFTFLSSFGLVYAQWGFGTVETGLTFIPIGIGYILAYLIWLPFIYWEQNKRHERPGTVKPETRLLWLLFTAPLLSIGLFCFAWTSTGPPMSWSVSMIFSMFIGIANFAIYGSTVDYMVEAYGVYAASATGGNGFARDFLAGIAAVYSVPLYQNIGSKNELQNASMLLGALAVVFTIPIYIFYWYGPTIRARSKLAQELLADQAKKGDYTGKATMTQQQNTRAIEAGLTIREA